MPLKSNSGTSLVPGSKRQRFCESKGNLPRKPVHLVDAAYPTGASEICHLEGRIRAEQRNTEVSGYALAAIKTTVVDVAAKRRTATGDVEHLAL